ncbi:MAG: hypothetical protein GWO24_20070, partial [Akkermansiaceae bacterium]|nr:hypothetical protein [Akkermansiaceae bacterium]
MAVSFGSLLIGLQLQSAVVRFVAGTDKRAEQRAIFFPSLLVTAGLGAVVAVVAAKSSKMIATLILGDARYEGIGALLGLWIGLSACS